MSDSNPSPVHGVWPSAGQIPIAERQVRDIHAAIYRDGDTYTFALSQYGELVLTKSGLSLEAATAVLSEVHS